MTKAYKVGAHRLIASVKHSLTVAGISPHVSHDTASASYRKPVDHSDQRKAFADKINGTAGANSVPPHCLAAPPLTSLNPADAWPFARIEPETDREWRQTAPEAAL